MAASGFDHEEPDEITNRQPIMPFWCEPICRVGQALRCLCTVNLPRLVAKMNHNRNAIVTVMASSSGYTFVIER